MKEFVTWVICWSVVIAQGGLAWADEQANIATIKKFYEAYATGDANRVADFFSDDIAWRIPGRHPLSGEKRGKTEVTAFFAELAKAGFKAEPLFFGANEHYVVDIHRGWSNVQGYPDDLAKSDDEMTEGESRCWKARPCEGRDGLFMRPPFLS